MNICFIILLNFFFATLNVNADVVPASGGHISNGRFVVPEGDLLVKTRSERDAWLIVGDNTELIINGNIQLEGNGLSCCDIIRVTGKNVIIRGKGSIAGDKFTHTGSEGEWGMGIHFRGASNATLSGLTIKNCWGDCIYLSKNSNNIRIENCRIDHGRRQGITIVSADSVFIKKCTISNVSGTMPQYGIDIEPNRNCSVNYVLIDNVNVTNCEGGIRAIVPKAGIGSATIGTVVIRKCRVSAKSRHPIQFTACKTATVDGCIIEATNERPCINANYVENLKICNNTLNVDMQLLSSIKNKLRQVVGRKNSVIRVANGSDKGVKNNKIVKK